MNVAVQSPTGTTRTMAPPSSYLRNFTEGGGIKGLFFALSLRSRQSYFLPIPWPFAIPFPGCHRADHRSICLRHYVFGSHGRQDAKRLFILLLKLLGRSLRMGQSRLPHRAGTDLKTIMFQHPRRGAPKGMFATKVRQYPLQTN